jgi:prefoldin subunit 5
MSETTEIEKKSLEAHVELCAERYSSLDQRLDNLGNKINRVEHCTEDIREIMSAHVEKHNDRLIAWGVGIIGMLIGTIGWLMASYVFK